MVARRHDDAADLRPPASMPVSASLTQLYVLVIHCADHANRCHALAQYLPVFARGQTQQCVSPFSCQHLGRRTGAPDDLATLAYLQLNVVDLRSCRDPVQRQSVARSDRRVFSRLHLVAHSHSIGSEYVSPFAVRVFDEGNPGGPVRVVLDGRHLAGYSQLVSLEVDDPVPALVAPPRCRTVILPDRPSSGPLLERLQQRLLGRVGSQIVRCLHHRSTLAGGNWFQASKRHITRPRKS